MLNNPKIAFIGAGKLSWNLIPALQQAGAQVVQLISRTEEKRKRFCEAFEILSASASIGALSEEAEVVFLTVGDQSIASVVEEISGSCRGNAIFVHTSGSVPLTMLDALGESIGVFYPMQVFTEDKQVSFEKIPFFLEGAERVLEVIQPMAEAISDSVQELNSAQRLKLHLGAVLVSNFPNYLYRLAAELVPEAGIHAFESLIRGHIEKVFEYGPQNTQTGPAIRGDMNTLYQHLEILQDDPKKREMYWLLSSLIGGESRE
jgi:predicted short-subunit dehydrogenase-like oxidoreductase (DUF2520 family)